MPVWGRWTLAILVAGFILGVPTAYYRAGYAHAKRLREIEPGQAYRCGQLTANGFREAVRRYGIRTVINLQEEAKDPFLAEDWQKKPSISESDVCEQLGVRYVKLDGGVLDHPGEPTGGRPRVIEEFLEIMDDPANRPVLFHCKAGLHRTGLLAAVYRMEYDGWSKGDAVRELRANGFGTFAATDGNDYLKRFILDYKPGVRRGQHARAAQPPAVPKKAGE